MNRMRCLCVLLLLFPAIAAPLSAAPANTVDQPRPLITATYIQLLDRHNAWTSNQWEELFTTFRSIGIRQVVVQWSLHDETAFFASRKFRHSLQPPLETILKLAQKQGIEVYLGLAADSAYWEMLKQPGQRRDEYLDRLRRKSEQVARELLPIVAGHPSFKGWYLPEEIDDLTWRPHEARALLSRHLARETAFLKALTPAGAVMLSGFSRARLDPASYENFWRDLLSKSSVDVLLFQDGAGTAHLPPDLLPIYLNAVRRAADAAGRKLQVVVELFTLVSESPFRAVPAPLARVIRQLETAAGYATGGINSFSIPNYMSPQGDAPARELFRGYLKYKGGDLSPPR